MIRWNKDYQCVKPTREHLPPPIYSYIRFFFFLTAHNTVQFKTKSQNDRIFFFSLNGILSCTKTCARDIDVHTSPGLFTKRVTSFMTCNKVSVRASQPANSGVRTFVGRLVKTAYTKTSLARALKKKAPRHPHDFFFLGKEELKEGLINF